MKIKHFLIFLAFIYFKANAQAPNYLWAKTVTDTVATGSFGRGVATDANGNVFAAGYLSGARMVIGTDTLFNNGQTDAYLLKFDEFGNILWSRSVGGPSEEHAYAVAVDMAGNSFLVGHFFSATLTVGSFTLTKVGMRDAFIVKYDPNGNVLWAKCGGGSEDEICTSVTVDPAGNVIVTGVYESPTATFDAVALTNVSSPGNGDVFVLKYDPAGNLIWAKSNGGLQHESAIDIVSDSVGNLFVSGLFHSASFSYGPDVLTNGGTTSYCDMFIAKYDASGNVLWARSAGGAADDSPYSIDVDSSSNIIVAGSFRSPAITFETTTLTNVGLSDMFLVKYDSVGNIMWAKRDGGAYDECPRGISVDSEDNIAMAGTWSGWSTSIAGTTLTVVLGDEIFVAKYDASGTGLWSKSTASSGTENAAAIVSDPNNNLVLTGMMNASLTFGTITLAPPGSFRFYLAKLNNSIGLVWPGDANSDHIVSNTDLLPIGLHYAQTGAPRTVMGNVWQADSSANWGMLQANGADIKHTDCNGDGTIDNNDTLAINLNFSLTHAFAPSSTEFKLVNPNLYFTSIGGIYLPGSWINVDIMAGTSSLPVSNLYGLAFDINYDASLVQPGTESLIYPNSWFASPGTNAIKIGKTDALANKAYGAETRITHTNADGYGKIATFRFQTNSSISSLSIMNFSYSGYMANDSVGNNLLFNPQSYSVVIDPLATTIKEEEGANEIAVYPNPSHGNFNVMFTSQEKANYKLELRNVLGQLVYQETLPDFIGTYSKPISIGNYGKGVYTITLTNDKNDVVKKIIVY